MCIRTGPKMTQNATTILQKWYLKCVYYALLALLKVHRHRSVKGRLHYMQKRIVHMCLNIHNDKKAFRFHPNIEIDQSVREIISV